MKRLTTFLMALLLTWIGANAQIAEGDYMVVNTETGQFLYGSYNWGSCASLGSKPVYYTVAATSGGYTLTSTQWTATDKGLFLTGDGAFYCDGTPGTVVLTEADDGSYTMSISGTYMLAQGKNATITATADASQASHWKFVSLQDVIDSMEGASSANPVDVTALIDDANFKPNGNGLTAKNNWTATDVTIGSYASNATAACCAETYHKESYSISQTITLPKAGYYNLSAQGFYRDDSSSRTGEITAQMFAGEQAVNLNARQTTANSMSAAWGVFLEGSEPVPSITIYAEEADEEVSIGFSGADSEQECWVIFGELQLEYLGETLEYAIGEPECTTAYVQPGGELTITFPNCVTPNTNEEPVLSTTAGSITVNGTAVTDAVLTSTGLTSTVTFTVPTTLAQGAEVTVIVPAGLVTWAGTDVSSPAQNVTFTLHTPAIADQMGVYLMNCNTEEYLSRGYNWGTRADVDYYGIPVDIVADEDGLYTIQYVDNSGYLGDTGWAYGDCGTDRWVHYTIESYNADGVTGYRFKCEEASTDYDRYLYLNENNTENDDVNEPLVANNGLLNDNYTVESQAVWQIHDEAAHTAQKAAFVASQKAAIAALVDADDLDTYIESQTATDVTFFVEDPSFDSAVAPDDATETSTGWVGSYTHTENGNNGNFSSGGTTSGFESWNGCIQLQQTITDLPSGVYKIDLKGFFRQATNIICYTYKDYDMSTAFIDANGYEINLAPWASEASITGDASVASGYSPNSKADSYTACATGYANELYTYVGEDGTLVITIDNQGYAFDEWMYLREMSLTYYGDIEDDCDYADGEEVTIDGTTYTVVGENMFVNGGFNYGVEGWTAGNTYTDALSADNVTLTGTGGYNGNTYLTLKSSAGAAAETTPTQAIAVEAGKTYLFVGYTSGTAPTEGNLRYSALFEMYLNEDGEIAEKNHDEDGTSYSNTIIQLEWGNAGEGLNGWTKTEGVFTVPTAEEESTYGTYSYVGMRMNWSTGSYDGFQLYEVTTEETIEWTMTDAGWGTLILPFAADVPEGLTLYAGDALDLSSDGTAITVSEASTSIVANTPYLVKGDADTYTFSGTVVEADDLTSGMLTGTYETLDCDALLAAAGSNTVYLLQNHDGDVAFYPVVEEESADATLTPYHCYLTIEGDDSVSPTMLSIGHAGEETSIKAVESDVIANDAIYDLSGRRVSKAVKGVYIQNGKKVLVK